MDPADGAVERVWVESYAWLVGRVTLLTRDRAEAEDVVAEAFVRALSAWSQPPESPRAWLLTTALNLARGRHRRRLRGRDLHRLAGWQDSFTHLTPDRVAVISALRMLPPAQREAIVLHHIADLPLSEISAALDVPVGTVKARLSRGRAALELLLADDEPPSRLVTKEPRRA